MALLDGFPLVAFVVLLVVAFVLAAYQIPAGRRAPLATYIFAASFVALLGVLAGARGLAGAAANAIVDPDIAPAFEPPDFDFQAPEFEFPDIETPEFPEFPDFEIPEFETPEFPEFPTPQPVPAPPDFDFQRPPQGLGVYRAAQVDDLSGRDVASAEAARSGIIFVVSAILLWLHASKARKLLNEEAE